MRRLAAAYCVLALLLATALHAEDIFALTASNKLLRFDSASPGTIISAVQITGLQSSENIVGIDFRPNTGQLYGVGSLNRLYVINVTSGIATQAGTGTFATPLSGMHFGVNFNPTADRLRCVSDTAQNLRFNPNDGTVTVDTNLTYAAGDLAAGVPPHIVSAAYTNNLATANSTTLYAIDSALDTLVTVGTANSNVSPNGGLVFTVGKLGVNTSDFSGFDISGVSGVAYASLMIAGEAASKLFTINLTTGTATLVGPIAGGEIIYGIAVNPAPTPFEIVALRSNGTLTRFNSETPGATPTVSTSIIGLAAGDQMWAIDYRPANGVLYGLAVNGSNNTGRIYTVDPITGIATQITPAAMPISLTNAGNAQGLNFDPTTDRIRIMNEDRQNLVVNPDNGVLVSTDTPLTYNAADVNKKKVPDISTIGFTNVANAATSLYGIDATLNTLVIVNPPFSSGVLTTVGGLGVPVNTFAGLDVGPTGVAFAAINSSLYSVNLATGVATQLGTVGIGGGNIRGIAVVPAVTQQTLQLSAANFQVTETALGAVVVTRTGSASGVVTVDYTVTSGTAIAGTNFTAVSGTLTFLNGETTRTIIVPTINDNKLDLFLTANVTLSNPVGAKLGAQGTATLTIADINDLDGDGFPNDIEAAAGTVATDPASTPFGGAPAGVAQPLTIKSVSARLNFLTPVLMDSVSFGGTFANTLSTIPAGATFIAEAGDVNGKSGVIQVFTFDAKGKSTPRGLTISKPRNGISTFSVSLTKGTFAAGLLGAGLTNATVTKVPLKLNYVVYFNKTTYAGSANVTYTATLGKTGSVTIAR